MTTVAAIARDGVVYMAADGITSVYERPMPGGIPKIRRMAAGSEPVLLGFAGEGAMPGLVGADLVIDAAPARDADPQPWALAVARAITDIAVEAGCVDDGRMTSHVLLGWSGRLWTLSHRLAVPHPDGIAAIGSGGGPAIGAIDAHLSNGTHPRDALTAALHIAIHRDKHSGHPVQFETLGPAQGGPVSSGTLVNAIQYQPGTVAVAQVRPPGRDLELGTRQMPLRVDKTSLDQLSAVQRAGMIEHSQRTMQLRRGLP